MTAPANRPPLPAVLRRFETYYRENPTWGSLHIVLDDGNLEDSSVQFCIDWAEKNGDSEGQALATELLHMSWSQRNKLSRGKYEINPHEYVGNTIPEMYQDWATQATKVTLQQFQLARPDDVAGQKFAAVGRALMDRGFSGDYRMSYNVAYNAEALLGLLPTVHADDIIWLCNQLAKIHGSRDCGNSTYECTDNFRMCHGSTRNSAYRDAKEHGCCGFVDVVLTNPETGNSYCYGFNHGH